MTDIHYYNLLKHAAKEACRENGIKVFMNHMVLLEGGMSEGMVDYVMFRDLKSGKEYQCGASWGNCTYEHPSRWLVAEYKS